MRDYRIALWENYSWSIAYYYSIKLHKEWDVIYHNLESNSIYWIRYYNAAEVSNASWVDNATKYIQSQYNPLIVENVAPVILKFSVEFHYYVVTAEFDVHAMVADAGNVEKIKIVDSDFGQSAEWTVNTRVKEVTHTFWASPWGANLGANISVKAWDVRKNKVVINKTVLGPVGQALELLWSLLPAWLRRALVSAARAVVQGLKMIGDWIGNLLENTLSMLSEKGKEIQNELAKHYMGFIMAVYSNETRKGVVEFLRILAFVLAITGTLIGLYWGLAIAVNANPIFGSILAGLVMAAFMTVFYLLYPEEYREAGEALISVGNLLQMPADEVYEFDKQYCGGLGYMLSAINGVFGAYYIGTLTNSNIGIFLTWVLGMLTLFAMIPLLGTGPHNSTMDKVITVGLLAIASYGLWSVILGIVNFLKTSHSIGGYIAFIIFTMLFLFIGAYNELVLIGYLHKE